MPYVIWTEQLTDIADAGRRDMYEYFHEQFNTGIKNRTKQALLIMAALGGGPRVTEWAYKQPIAEIMLENNRQGLILCLTVYKEMYNRYARGFEALAKIPEVAANLLESVISLRDLKCAREHFHQKFKFTRENCLHQNGAVLRRFFRRSEIKWLITKYGLSKSDLASVGLPWPVK